MFLGGCGISHSDSVHKHLKITLGPNVTRFVNLVAGRGSFLERVPICLNNYVPDVSSRISFKVKRRVIKNSEINCIVLRFQR